MSVPELLIKPAGGPYVVSTRRSGNIVSSRNLVTSSSSHPRARTSTSYIAWFSSLDESPRESLWARIDSMWADTMSGSGEVASRT